MFFLFAKTVGAFLTHPIYIALLLVGLGLGMRRLSLWPRARLVLLWGALVQLWLCSTGAFASVLLYPLETQYKRPAQYPEPAAIVMLAGIVDNQRRGSDYDLTDGADRFVETFRLAHQYPKARVVFTGGSGSLMGSAHREAETLARLAVDMGLDASRLLIDSQSRNTRENAIQVEKLLRDAQIAGPVMLVTSASHMPRSVGCFRKVGIDPIAWPVDYYRTYSRVIEEWLPSGWSLFRTSIALHEYWGLLAYRMQGYT